ncbi:hypothetical protein IPU70_07925 [Achromobacter sp. SD115]|uniref:Uncharacterized protein n=1 Tax=Achromobacter anxifer TaxID=1287737 RepID=A0A6S7DMM8_9BURK|nr:MULTISPECIES: hypothetical protein [Achromobacter]MBO1013471.1 hypothetical protein [Achromobacter sp. SD115]CAB3862810.1 hypothetical protein LMG26858_02310 [Achromobacter anxifer]
MTAATLWVLLAFLPAGHDRPPVMVVERFATQAECLDVLAVFPPTTRVTFDCMPSRQIRAGVPPMENRQL